MSACHHLPAGQFKLFAEHLPSPADLRLERQLWTDVLLLTMATTIKSNPFPIDSSPQQPKQHQQQHPDSSSSLVSRSDDMAAVIFLCERQRALPRAVWTALNALVHLLRQAPTSAIVGPSSRAASAAACAMAGLKECYRTASLQTLLRENQRCYFAPGVTAQDVIDVETQVFVAMDCKVQPPCIFRCLEALLQLEPVVVRSSGGLQMQIAEEISHHSTTLPHEDKNKNSSKPLQQQTPLPIAQILVPPLDEQQQHEQQQQPSPQHQILSSVFDDDAQNFSSIIMTMAAMTSEQEQHAGHLSGGGASNPRSSTGGTFHHQHHLHMKRETMCGIRGREYGQAYRGGDDSDGMDEREQNLSPNHQNNNNNSASTNENNNNNNGNVRNKSKISALVAKRFDRAVVAAASRRPPGEGTSEFLRTEEAARRRCRETTVEASSIMVYALLHLAVVAQKQQQQQSVSAMESFMTISAEELFSPAMPLAVLHFMGLLPVDDAELIFGSSPSHTLSSAASAAGAAAAAARSDAASPESAASCRRWCPVFSPVDRNAVLRLASKINALLSNKFKTEMAKKKRKTQMASRNDLENNNSNQMAAHTAFQQLPFGNNNNNNNNSNNHTAMMPFGGRLSITASAASARSSDGILCPALSGLGVSQGNDHTFVGATVW